MRWSAQPSRRIGNCRLPSDTPSLKLYATQHRWITRLPARPARNLVRVLAPRQQRDRRLQQDVDVEQHRPVLDVIEIELDALLDLLFVVDLAAPAIDLRPA